MHIGIGVLVLLLLVAAYVIGKQQTQDERNSDNDFYSYLLNAGGKLVVKALAFIVAAFALWSGYDYLHTDYPRIAFGLACLVFVAILLVIGSPKKSGN